MAFELLLFYALILLLGKNRILARISLFFYQEKRKYSGTIHDIYVMMKLQIL